MSIHEARCEASLSSDCPPLATEPAGFTNKKMGHSAPASSAMCPSMRRRSRSPSACV